MLLKVSSEVAGGGGKELPEESVQLAQVQTCDPPDAGSTPKGPAWDSTRFRLGAVHEIVGADGVLMITLDRDPFRFEFVLSNLTRAGIYPTKFLGTDGKCASHAALNKGCAHSAYPEDAEWCSRLGKAGLGCVSNGEQAVADAHRRALEMALKRESEWTLIMEDDTVPLRPSRWNKAFRNAWAHVPPETKIVRLSWCLPGEPWQVAQPIWRDSGDFILSKWSGFSEGYRSGGCTGAYMVHKDIIPELLGVFPCCCAVDCCFEIDFFNRPLGENGQTRGSQILLNMDTWGSSEYIEEYAGNDWGTRYGIMMASVKELPSTKWSLLSLVN